MENEQSTSSNDKGVLMPLKRKGKLGLIAGGSVLGLLLVISLLSKLNEVRHHRLPLMWRNRLKTMVKNSAKHLKISRDSNDDIVSYHHAVQAQSTLESAKSLIGSGSLTKLTGLNVEKLEEEIENSLHNFQTKTVGIQRPTPPPQIEGKKPILRTRFSAKPQH